MLHLQLWIYFKNLFHVHYERLKHIALLVEDEFVHAQPAERVVPINAPFCVFLNFRLKTIPFELKTGLNGNSSTMKSFQGQYRTYIYLLIASKSYITGGSVSNFMCLYGVYCWLYGKKKYSNFLLSSGSGWGL